MVIYVAQNSLSGRRTAFFTKQTRPGLWQCMSVIICMAIQAASRVLAEFKQACKSKDREKNTNIQVGLLYHSNLPELGVIDLSDGIAHSKPHSLRGEGLKIL
jgi:hypothetical protein